MSLTADSRVTKNGAAYSVIGEIPGTGDETLYMTAHYDGYFYSFDDNASGVGAVMGIAKAIVESGYKPQKTIRFILHPAAKWGLSDSKYDWAVGANATIDKHPGWARDAFALISIDGGVMSNVASGIRISASPELLDFALRVGYDVETNPLGDFEAVPLNAPLTEGFVYAKRGIPVLCSGFSGISRQIEEVYQTNMDTINYFYNEETLLYTQKLYGTYLIELDRQPVKPLDFSRLFEAMLDAADTFGPVKAQAFENAICNAIDASYSLNDRISGDLGKDAQDFNRQLFDISLAIQKNLISLTWDDEIIFAHERHIRNINRLSDAVEALKKGDAETAVRDYLSKVDLNGYALWFDNETYDYFVDQALAPDALNSWGTGFINDNTDLYGVMRAIKTKSESVEKLDFRDEMETIDIAIISRQKLLRNAVEDMTKEMISITRAINRLAE